MLLLAFGAQAQVNQYNWYGTQANNEYFYSVLALPIGPTAATNFYVSGFRVNPANNQYEGIITNLQASNQAILWVKSYTGPNGEHLIISDIQESHSGNLIVVGTYRPDITQASNMNLYVMEVSRVTGAVLVAKAIARTGNNRIILPKITKTIDDAAFCEGTYILECWRTTGGGGADDILAMKLDYSLNPIWAFEYGATGNDDQPQGIVAEPGGGAVIAGYTSQGGVRGFLLKLDTYGNQTMTNLYSGPGGSNFLINNIIRSTAPGGGFVFNGRYQAANGGFSKGVVGKFDASCNTIWAKSYAPSEEVDFSGLSQTTTGNSPNIYTGYYTSLGGSGGFRQRILKVSNSGGSPLFRDHLGAFPSQGVLPIHCTTNRVLVAAGRTFSSNLLEGFLGVLSTTLTVTSPSACQSNVSGPLVTLALTKTQSTLDTSDVLPLLTVTAHCDVSAPTFAQAVDCGLPYLTGQADARASMENDPVLNFKPSHDMPAWPASQSVPTFQQPTEQVTETGTRFQIFPNPAAETVELTFDNSDETNETASLVQIFDAMGKLVKTQTVLSNEQNTLDLSDLPKGIYSVKVGDGPAQKLTRM